MHATLRINVHIFYPIVRFKSRTHLVHTEQSKYLVPKLVSSSSSTNSNTSPSNKSTHCLKFQRLPENTTRISKKHLLQLCPLTEFEEQNGPKLSQQDLKYEARFFVCCVHKSPKATWLVISAQAKDIDIQKCLLLRIPTFPAQLINHSKKICCVKLTSSVAHFLNP